VTEKGYLGVGMESLAVGDVVMLVAGADVPHVFRPTITVGEKEAFTLVGEAYVHGIMQGEGLAGGEAAMEEIRVV